MRGVGTKSARIVNKKGEKKQNRLDFEQKKEKRRKEKRKSKESKESSWNLPNEKRSECDVVAVGRRPARSSSLLAQSSSLGRSSLGRSSLGCRVARSSRRSVVTSLLARSLCRSPHRSVSELVASLGRRVARSSSVVSSLGRSSLGCRRVARSLRRSVVT